MVSENRKFINLIKKEVRSNKRRVSKKNEIIDVFINNLINAKLNFLDSLLILTDERDLVFDLVNGYILKEEDVYKNMDKKDVDLLLKNDKSFITNIMKSIDLEHQKRIVLNTLNIIFENLDPLRKYSFQDWDEIVDKRLQTESIITRINGALKSYLRTK